MALRKFRDKTKEKPKKNFLPFEERQTIARLIIEGHGYEKIFDNFNTVAHQKVLPLKVLRFLKNPKPPYIPKCTILSKKCYLFLKTSEQNCNTF